MTEIILIGVAAGGALWCTLVVILALYTDDAAKTRELAERLGSLATLLAQRGKALKAGENAALETDDPAPSSLKSL
jgi:hypothetical protein